MKRFVIIFISLIVGYALYWCISDYNYRYNKINSIVGIYKLDFNHTDSEIYKDSIEKYNNLRLIFNSDMTFSLSFSVPFMADTVFSSSSFFLSVFLYFCIFFCIIK